MARYILVDNYSGYIFGDSADLQGKAFDGTPEEFAEALDASIGEYGRTYEMRSVNPRDTSTGYHVYRADIDGEEVVGPIQDGQDMSEVRNVQEYCRYLGFIAATKARDDDDE